MHMRRRAGFIAFVCVAAGMVASQRAAGVTLDLPLSADGQAKSTDQVNFFINYPSDPVYVDWTPYRTPIQEQRGVLEFNLSGLPAGALLQSADLLFNVSLYETRIDSSNTYYPSVTFWSYAGNNAIDVSDAAQTNDALATLNIDSTGPWDVPLNLTRVRGLIAAHAAAVGVLAYANSQDLTVGLWTAASPPGVAAPTIELTYAPAGDANFDDRVDGDDYALIDRGSALQLTGWGNGDFNGDGVIDESDYLLIDTTFGLSHGFTPAFLAQRADQFGDAYVSGLLASVPEPSVLFLGVCVLGLLSRVRRGVA